MTKLHKQQTASTHFVLSCYSPDVTQCSLIVKPVRRYNMRAEHVTPHSESISVRRDLTLRVRSLRARGRPDEHESLRWRCHPVHPVHVEQSVHCPAEPEP